MKKFLSLVLALVMTMSLVTVSSSAAYADADDITYVEAVDVLSAIGVLSGDASGFRPNDTLKRSEAAKIISALTLSPKTAASLSADAAPFADVAKTHWAAGYIAECADSGIIGGVGNNKFNPDGKLTGFAFAKMLLCALGYDAEIEGMTGSNWTVNVAKLAKKVELTDGIADFVGTADLTREQAAQMGLNALQAETVEYDDKGTSITINGVVIATGADAAKGTTEIFKDDNFDRLRKTSPQDKYGRPATKWTWKGEEVGVYAKTPVLVITEEMDKDDFVDALEDAGYEDVVATGNIGDTIAAINATYTNSLGSANGKVIEFYGKTMYTADGTTTVAKTTADAYDIDVIYDVVTISTTLEEVSGKTSDKARTEDEDERAITLVGGAGKLVADKDVTTGVEVDNFDELYDDLKAEDKVLVAWVAGTIVEASIPEKVEGKVKGWSAKNDEINIDGTNYAFSDTCAYTGTLKATYYTGKNTIDAYLDNYGYIIGGTTDGSSSDVVYLVAKYNSSDKYNTKTYFAQLVTAAGEVEELEMTETQYNDATVAANKLYTYTTNNNDEIVLTAVTIGTAADEAFAIAGMTVDTDKSKLNGVYYDDEVAMVFVKKSGADLAVTAASFQDHKNVPANSYAVVNEDGYVDVIFVREAAKSYSDDDEIIYIDDAACVYEDEDVEIYEAWIDTNEDEEITIDEADTAPALRNLYKFTVDNDGLYELENVTGDAKKATSPAATIIARDKYITLEGTEYTMADDAVVVDVDGEGLTTLAAIKNFIKNDFNGAVEDLYIQALVNSDNEITYMVVDIVAK